MEVSGRSGYRWKDLGELFLGPTKSREGPEKINFESDACAEIALSASPLIAAIQPGGRRCWSEKTCSMAMLCISGSSKVLSSSFETAASGKLCGVGGARSSLREIKGGVEHIALKAATAHGAHLDQEHWLSNLRARRTWWVRGYRRAVKNVV